MLGSCHALDKHLATTLCSAVCPCNPLLCLCSSQACTLKWVWPHRHLVAPLALLEHARAWVCVCYCLVRGLHRAGATSRLDSQGSGFPSEPSMNALQVVSRPALRAFIGTCACCALAFRSTALVLVRHCLPVWATRSAATSQHAAQQLSVAVGALAQGLGQVTGGSAATSQHACSAAQHRLPCLSSGFCPGPGGPAGGWAADDGGAPRPARLAVPVHGPGRRHRHVLILFLGASASAAPQAHTQSPQASKRSGCACLPALTTL